eukprot:snap_masked-scaffold_17-processed-gene-0.15-mRNA-1 protein AED:1.00 eAED:1.00 QI:0/-1/0/0/-1/1/1/0/66
MKRKYEVSPHERVYQKPTNFDEILLFGARGYGIQHKKKKLEAAKSIVYLGRDEEPDMHVGLDLETR